MSCSEVVLETEHTRVNHLLTLTCCMLRERQESDNRYPRQMQLQPRQHNRHLLTSQVSRLPTHRLRDSFSRRCSCRLWQAGSTFAAASVGQSCVMLRGKLETAHISAALQGHHAFRMLKTKTQTDGDICAQRHRRSISMPNDARLRAAGHPQRESPSLPGQRDLASSLDVCSWLVCV